MKNTTLAPPLSQPAPMPWDTSRSYIRVMLRDVQAEAHVGLHPWERHTERPTRLIVNVEMFAPLDSAPADGHDAFLDYDPVRAALRDWPNRPHTPLLETLAEEIVRLCFQNARVAACRVSVLKPDIFNEAAAAGVEIYRVREEG
jgi:7,8-dihydroneopterin aldolase/epimerase/oxygenase